MLNMKAKTSRRVALACLLAAALSAPLAGAQVLRGTGGPAQSALAQAGGTELTGTARSEALSRASASLNGIRTLQGRFVQIAQGSAVRGQFYMQRPGRLRFAYDPPATMLIVADGTVVAIQDTALRSVNRAPLNTTPLYFVLKNNVNLERDARVTRVARSGDTLYVTARDRTGNADGQITFALVGPSMELRSWDVVDATGARTRLALAEVSRPASIDQRLFRTPVPQSTGRPR